MAGPDRTLDRDTAAGYLDILNRLMVTEDLPAWAPHMRSATPLRKSAARFMVDPSLAVAALGVGPEQLLRDLNATGFLFESLVLRDLRVYSQPLRGRLARWRDNNNHEVDIIITIGRGSGAASACSTQLARGSIRHERAHAQRTTSSSSSSVMARSRH